MERHTKSLAVVGRRGWYMRWLMRVNVSNSSSMTTSRGERRKERKGRGEEGRGGRERVRRNKKREEQGRVGKRSGRMKGGRGIRILKEFSILTYSYKS